MSAPAATSTDNTSQTSSHAISGEGSSYGGSDGFSSTDSRSASFSVAETYTSNLTATSSYSINLGGVFGNGSYSLASVVYRQNGAETFSSTYLYSSTEQGWEYSSYQDSGTREIQSSSSGGNGSGSSGGGTTMLGTYTNSGDRTTSFTGTETLAQSGSFDNTYSLYQAGSWSNGSFSYASDVAALSSDIVASVAVEYFTEAVDGGAGL